MDCIEFENYLRERNIKESTIRKYVSVFENIPEYVFTSIENINKFLQERARKYNDATVYSAVIKHYLRARKLFEWLQYLAPVKIYRRKRPANYYDLQTIFDILDNMPTEQYRIAGYVQLFAGLRAFEVMNLTRKDISILSNKAILQVRTAKREPYQAIVVGRGFEVLKTYLEKHNFKEDDFVFHKEIRTISVENKIKTNTTYYQKEIRKTAESLGLKLTSHDLKRNLGRLLYEKLGDVYKVKEMLHHAKVETTLRYIGAVSTREAEEVLKQI